MKRNILLVCCVMVAGSVALFTGCNRGNAPQTPASDTTKAAETSTTATPASGSGATITGAALDGQKIFYNASLGKIKIACAACHSDGETTTKDARLRAGHTLVGVTSRTETWNGEFKGDNLKKNAYGASLCASLYQATTTDGDYSKALSPADIDALNAYFAAIAANPGGITKNIAIQWGTKPAFKDDGPIDKAAAMQAAKSILKLPGDAGSGEAVWTQTCAYCHSMTDKKIGPPMVKAMDAMDRGAAILRSGANRMVFYGRDILTDQQCADVLAYIQKQLGK